MTRGQSTSFDKAYTLEFTEWQQIAGFVGYELGKITALGVWRYICDTPPPLVEPDTEVVDEESSSVVLIVVFSILIPFIVILAIVLYKLTKKAT